MPGKTLPTTQVANPSHQLAAFRDLCSALSRLSSRPWQDDALSSTPEIAKGAEASLKALITELTPEHQLLKQVLYSGSAQVLADLFDIHGAESYLAIHAKTPVAFSEPVKRANIAQLRILAKAGFDLRGEEERMMRQIRRHEDAAYLSFLRDELGFNLGFMSVLELSSLLNDLPEFLVGPIAAELKECLGLPPFDPASRVMMRAGAGLRVKHFALLLGTGRSLKPVLTRSYPASPDIDPAARLVYLAESNHGRMELARLEPDYEAMLRRKNTETFFGLTEDEFHTYAASWPTGQSTGDST